MLKEHVVKEMAKSFFGGNPEKAYSLISNMSEWDQFINSIKSDENQIKAYNIMAKSDLTLWHKNAVEPYYEKYPTYGIGY